MNNMEKEILEVSLDDIIPNRFQPRLSFDEDELNELAKSIRQHGIIQPLVLRKVGNKYEIIAGERRYKASFIAGLTKVPAVIIDLNDNESAEVAIVENIQRKNLSALEEAKSYKKLLDRGYLTQEELAIKMGKTQGAISNKLRLLNLSEEVQNALLNNEISERHARSLLKVDNKEDQVEHYPGLRYGNHSPVRMEIRYGKDEPERMPEY
jgi:ParB family chromosome partitioning protein